MIGPVSSPPSGPQSGPRSLPRWSRAAAVAAIGLVGAALIAMVWTTRKSVLDARATLLRGQAAEAHGLIRARMMELADAPTEERVDAAFDAAAGQHVRYLALLDADDRIVAEAGAPRADRAELVAWAIAAAPATPEQVGERVRVVFKRIRRPDKDEPPPPGAPPPSPSATAPGTAPGTAPATAPGPAPATAPGADAAPAADAAPPRPRGPSTFVLELDPRRVVALHEAATWSLVIGGAAAATLLLLTAVLVRWSLRREDAVRAVEQARHLASLGQMSAVLAHEIRNPLASLKGNAQLLARSLPDGERPRAKADRVVDEAIRLEHLTNDLLDFARSGEIRIADADPAQLLRAAAGEAAPGPHDARITIDDAGAPRSWPLDAERIRQVLRNLLDNAVEMSEGPVEARVARDGGHLVFTVRDHGPGLGDADLDRVFEPFFTRRTRGTGLGLAVCKRLVELHGGTIAAANAPGGGARFELRLPRGAG